MKIAYITAVLFALGSATNEEGLAYLSTKASETGVNRLPSGLLYKIIRRGAGLEHPRVDTPCDVHYEGTLPDGSVFDSSYKRGTPTTFAPNQVIKGWTEALQLMVAGDKWEVYLPSELAYGDGGSGSIPPGAALTFKMELIELKGPGVPSIKCDPATGDECTNEEKQYIAKAKTWDTSKLKEETDRISAILGKKLNPGRTLWANRRRRILELLAESAKKNSAGEL